MTTSDDSPVPELDVRAAERMWADFLGRIGAEFHSRIEVVFERFRVVWPPEIADD